MGIVSLEGIVAFFPLKQKRGWGSFYKNAKGGNYAKRKCKTKLTLQIASLIKTDI